METYWEQKFISLLHKTQKSEEEIQEMENARIEFEKELNSETFDLLNEIKKNGLIINDIWDLVNTVDSYGEAIEPLTNHLSRPYHDKNKEGIIRALGVKEAGIITLRALLIEYPNCTNKSVSNAIIFSIFNIIKRNSAKRLFDETNSIKRYYTNIYR